MIITTGDLIQSALTASGLLGIGQFPVQNDLDTGLDLLRMLIAQWQKKRWLLYVLQEVSVPSSTGAQAYSIGPNCDFNVNARPAKIAAAYARFATGVPPNLVDFPLGIVEAREDYDTISIKTLSTTPAIVWYESGYPTGRLFFWPVPPAGQYGLFVTIQLPLPTYTTQGDILGLPDEYIEALLWSMCIRLQMAYGRPARPDHMQAAKQAMNTLRQANTQIPTLSVPVPGGVRSGTSVSALSSPRFVGGW